MITFFARRFKAQINVSVTLGFTNSQGEVEGGIKVGLDIPTDNMSKDNPVKFAAVQTDKEGQPLKDGGSVLEVAVGDSEHIYVAVAPPQFLLEKAQIDNTVRALEVKVQEGIYQNGKFS
ncbi:MAG: hypothetical protein PHN64_08490 [Desulfovibrionaceae bacterium]|nr:hypothetical protein [Desulfovibrionaceae bacterium]